VQDELARHEAARESYGSNANREAWDCRHGTALLLIVAIDQVLTFRPASGRSLGMQNS
jgi:hypothetical protein